VKASSRYGIDLNEAGNGSVLLQSTRHRVSAHRGNRVWRAKTMRNGTGITVMANMIRYAAFRLTVVNQTDSEAHGHGARCGRIRSNDWRNDGNMSLPELMDRRDPARSRSD